MPTNSIPVWVQNRILGFFNSARNVDMILDGSIKDDPADGPGRTMGRRLAARILRERNALPRRRFQAFSELDNIRGVGEGTIRDLVHSFSVPAAEAFKQSMYESGTIYPENWPLECFRFTVDDVEEFRKVAYDQDNLRTFIAHKMEEICLDREVASDATAAMVEHVNKAYIDDYSNSTPAASYALALWFYEFDADNWFSWNQIQTQTAQYFNHNARSNNWTMDLYFFKGFQDKGLIEGGLRPDDLPVVVNHAEGAITFWVSALYD